MSYCSVLRSLLRETVSVYSYPLQNLSWTVGFLMSRLNIFQGIAFFSYSWRLGEFLCKFVAYIQTVSMVCSALTLTAMSIERYGLLLC